MDKVRCLKGAVFFIIAFFWASLAQAGNISLTVNISDLKVNLIKVTTGQIINPNDIVTQVQVSGGAFYPSGGPDTQSSTGTGSASIAYTGGYFNEIIGSANYNLSSNTGGVFITLNANGPNPSTAFGEVWASIDPYSSTTGREYDIRLNIHVTDYAKYALQISGNYAYNIKMSQWGINPFSYFFWDIFGTMRASFPILPLNTVIPLFNAGGDSMSLGLYNRSGTPIAPIEENYDSGMITGAFNYTTNPVLLIGGDYYCEFLIGDGIRGQTTPIPLPGNQGRITGILGLLLLD
jgi:hypothetical protein